MILVDGRSLELEGILRVAAEPSAGVELDPEAVERMNRSRKVVTDALDREDPVYGVTTGFGRLADVSIAPENQRALQRNLLRSHAAGTGPPLPRAETRALLLLRANALACGHSGCRVEVAERLLEFLRRGIHPVIPSAGSVGASGDLAPLAHAALPVIGEGRVEKDGSVRPAAEVLAEEGLEPLELEAKEGLALINGTQACTGVGAVALGAAENAVETADAAGAMSLEGARGTPDAFRPEVSRVRPQPGQEESARRLRHLLRDSEIRESHRYDDPRVQDAYCLRCMPQVHGASRQALGYVRRVLEVEANSATDNPLVFPDEAMVLSAGNFHAQPVAQALDLLVMALADLAAMSERRTERLLNPDLSGLPAFLTPDPGLRSGLMIAQVTAADLLAELRALAHPVSVDSVPTSANQEDHVSMGMAAARKARRAVECVETVLAIELMTAAQALDFLRPLRPGEGVEEVHRHVRSVVPPLDEDRELAPDLEAVRRLVAEGRFAGSLGIADLSGEAG